MTERTQRGVSFTLNYVLATAIAALLMSGLIVAGGNFVEDRRDPVVQEELTVVGQHVAAQLEQADRLVVASDDASETETRIRRSYPEGVAGTTYTVRLSASRETVFVNASTSEISVEVPVETETSLGSSSADGGPVAVVYDSGADELVIARA